MNDISLNKVKFKIISLIIAVLVLILLRKIERFSFDLFKGVYITILIIVALFVIILSIGLLIYHHKINDRIQTISYTVLDFTQTLAFAVVVIQCIFFFWFFPASVQGISMMPTLYDQERVLITVGNKDIERFDIVVIDASEISNVNAEDDLIIKRIIGLPGENFHYQNNKLFVLVDGEFIQIDEPFLVDEEGNYYTQTRDFTLADKCEINNNRCDFEGQIKIPEDYFFVLGDNRYGNSYDSRHFGLVHRSQIIGQAKYVKQKFLKWEKIK